MSNITTKNTKYLTKRCFIRFIGVNSLVIAKFLTLQYCEWAKIHISKETIDTVIVLTFQGRVTINRNVTGGVKYCLKRFFQYISRFSTCFPTSSESESI